MKIYLVGGAVRDELLGKVPSDRDFVVTGSSPEEMLSLGYLQVGESFPVFLHPITKEEYALARTEIKTGAGYQGFKVDFSPSVSLAEDLLRRDLTINAIAKDIKTGEIIDPLEGVKDLKLKLLRACNASSFAEDPVRVLRLARFSAKLEFMVEKDTKALALRCRDAGELSFLVKERVRLETEKAFKEKRADLFFATLNELLVLKEILPELAALTERDFLTQLKIISILKEKNADLNELMVSLTLLLSSPKNLMEALLFTREEQALIQAFLGIKDLLLSATTLLPEKLAEMMLKGKMLKDKEFFSSMMLLLESFLLANKKEEKKTLSFLSSLRKELMKMDLEKISLMASTKGEISEVIKKERIKVITKFLQEKKS